MMHILQSFQGPAAKRSTSFATLVGYLLLAVTFSLTFTAASAQSAENPTDHQVVLQKTLDLPALQPYYLKNADDTYAPVNVMQHPVAFEAGLAVQKFGKPVNFLQRRDVTASVRSYFLFHQFSVEGGKASVQAEYYFQSGNGELQVVKASIKLSKADGQWAITASEVSPN